MVFLKERLSQKSLLMGKKGSEHREGKNLRQKNQVKNGIPNSFGNERNSLGKGQTSADN